MYHSTSSPRASRSPCEELSGPRRGTSEIGSSATRVFFGATVTYKDAAGLEHVVSIVGIDEVDLDRGYISWRSPLANALMKASPGDRVELRAPAKTEHLEIIEVEYAPIPMDPFREPLGAQSTPKVERS